ncbi:MAG: hypothetical protein D6738_01775 [Acidobacteria bacterium]|nr:MAG: hypothetical protein D6738_01775 [Acidobacteriota bacterium]
MYDESIDLAGLLSRAGEETLRSISGLERIRRAHAEDALAQMIDRFIEIERDALDQYERIRTALPAGARRSLEPLGEFGIPALDETGPTDVQESDHPAGALLVALKRRARAAALFGALAARQRDPEVRGVLEALAAAERRRSHELRTAYRCAVRAAAGGAPAR